MRKRVSFFLQPTRSFQEGAPQREEYLDYDAFASACEKYAAEWLAEYECVGCADAAQYDCPQHRYRNRSRSAK